MFTAREWNAFLEFLQTPTAQCVIFVAILLVMTMAAVYLLRRFRDSINEERQLANELLTNYREMHDRGVISDTEYRTIRSRLAEELRERFNEIGEVDFDEPA